jgi:hypothetical protein
MPSWSWDPEARRLLSSNSSSSDEFDTYDKEALSDLKQRRSANFRFGGSPWLAWFRSFGCSRGMIRALAWLLGFAAALLLIEIYSLGLLSSPSPAIGNSQAQKNQLLPASVRLQKPVGPKIIGLIFYGRRDRAVILDCYLKKNLVINGGWLDEVIWGVNTDNADDLVYLEEIIPTSPFYRRIDLDERGYVNLWNQSVEYGNIYVKMDDDVVYIHEDTIPQIVHTLATETKAAIVSANVINSPEHNWIHYRSGAVRPYLPDLEPPLNGSLSTLSNPIWKVSGMPSWIGPPGWASPPVDKYTEELSRLLPPKTKEEQQPTELPYHRWLPLDDPLDISKTPISQTSYNAFGPGWSSWAIAAQQHYSFFHNLELGQLPRYYMNHGFGQNSSAIWDHTGDRLSINMLAITGDTILDHIDDMAASESDEKYLTEDLPRQTNRRTSPPSVLTSPSDLTNVSY